MQARSRKDSKTAFNEPAVPLPGEKRSLASIL